MVRKLMNEVSKLVGEEVLLAGWVDTVRTHGKIVFIDLRDRFGQVQVVFHKDISEKALEMAKTLKPEFVIELKGRVKMREQQFINESQVNGQVEVEGINIKILSEAKTTPFSLDNDGYDLKEELRIRYRYLDLRRERMKRNILVRHQVLTFIRKFLNEQQFVEIETPILTKSTPEGARDFLVPSRLQIGKFYALPQSPQQYKQLLMVSGFERYFQVARCFRDEDPRADRAYGEFTQLDMEMSFVTQEDLLQLTEKMFTELVAEVFPNKKIAQSPWPRISHAEAKAKYRNDKPDLRQDKNDPNELAFAWIVDFPLFTEQSDEDFFHGSGSAKFAPSHHMFTAPHPDDVALLDSDPTKVRGLQHDLVLNGFEVGGGSIRIHDGSVQQKIFDLIGFTENQKAEFSHMLEAFSFGVPPHGGIAPGVDRFLMVVLNEPSVREVVAFPAIASGKISVMDAPSTVAKQQLDELGLKVQDDSALSVFDRIIKLMTINKVPYKLFEHEEVKTSEEAAAVRQTPLSSGAKSLVLMADKKPIMVVLSADKKVDFKKIKELKNIKDLRMATPEEVLTTIGVEIGAVPPLGNLFNLEVIFDESIAAQKVVVFNAGDRKKSVELPYKHLENLIHPQVMKIS